MFTPLVGGTPLPEANRPACTTGFWATGLPAASVLAKLKPQTLSVTLKRPSAFT